MNEFSIKKVNDKVNSELKKFLNITILGYYSITSCERKYSEDAKNLKYLDKNNNLNNINFNLNDGIDKIIRRLIKNPKDEKMNFILKWISNNFNKIKTNLNDEKYLDSDFICMRGVLINISSTPYNKDGWILYAIKLGGNIYLHIEDNKNKKIDEKLNDKYVSKAISWGLKFHQYLLSESPKKPSDTSVPINENNEFCGVFTSNIDQHSLLYASVIHGIESDDEIKEPTDLSNKILLSIKTNSLKQYENKRYHYKLKLLNWYLQNIMVGCDKIICGLRTNDGIVNKIDEIQTSDLPNMDNIFWKDSVCTNFCNEFLNYLKEKVTLDYYECIYKFEFKANNDEILMEEILSTDVNYYDYFFLPRWYIDKYEEYNEIIDNKKCHFNLKEESIEIVDNNKRKNIDDEDSESLTDYKRVKIEE